MDGTTPTSPRKLPEAHRDVVMKLASRYDAARKQWSTSDRSVTKGKVTFFLGVLALFAAWVNPAEALKGLGVFFVMAAPFAVIVGAWMWWIATKDRREARQAQREIEEKLKKVGVWPAGDGEVHLLLPDGKLGECFKWAKYANYG